MPTFSGKTKIFYGPPGTGKTYRMLGELAVELKTVPPTEIAYVSFTREGTNQGVRQACAQFGYTRKEFPYFRTFHSIAFHALNMTMDGVMQPNHYRLFSDALGMHFTGYYTEEIHGPDDKYLFFIDLLRNNPKAATKFLEQLDYTVAKFVHSSYKAFKKQLKMYDYTDMITMFCNTAEPLPVRVAFIDEAQDLTTLQWQMAELAFRNCERIYIAGDDDQAIYQWSGADIKAFLSLEGEKHILDKSHRLPEDVLKFAKTITAQISERIPKEYTGIEKKGSVQYHGDLFSVPLTLIGTYMFLARNNKFLPFIKRHLEDNGIMYEDKKGISIKLMDIDTIHAWEEHTSGIKLEHSRALRMQQALGVPPEGLTGKWYDVFEAWSVSKREYIKKAIQRYGTITADTCCVRVNTIHTVKGAEAQHVILYLGMSKITWESYGTDPDAEHRAFYVGATRAKENLFIVYGTEKYSYELYTQEELDGKA